MSSAPGRPSTRSGFIALAGRPNVGKSTLTNALVGSKVAIVSDKPQTTRRAIRAVAGGADWQLVLVDLPGVQRPRDALTERMQRRVEAELDDADGCLMVRQRRAGHRSRRPLHRRPAEGRQGPDRDRGQQGRSHRPRARRWSVLQAADELGVAEAIFPISARKGTGVEQLLDHLVSLLPAGPFYFDRGVSARTSPSRCCWPSWCASRS